MRSSKLGIVAIMAMLIWSCSQSGHKHYEESAADMAEVMREMADE